MGFEFKTEVKHTVLYQYILSPTKIQEILLLVKIIASFQDLKSIFMGKYC